MPSTSATTDNVLLHPGNREWITDRLSQKPIPKWISGDIQPMNRQFLESDYSMYKDMSPVQLFQLFFDDGVFQFLTEETRKYALFKNEADPGISDSEIRCFIGILILSGYNNLPSKRSFWDMKDDVHNKMVSDAMRRNRFLQIQRFIHMADNTDINEADKAWKLRPLMNAIKEKCLANFQPVQDLSYDETMIKYYGRHGCKQFIRGKPIRFGYKMWSLNSKDGYLVNFDLYQGNDPKADIDISKLVGKCAAPMVLMLKELPQPRLPYNIYIDNLFTGFNLLAYLKNLGYGAVGTIRENRISKSCPITGKNQFQKKKRGEYEHIIEKNDGILLVRWMDNSVVTIASTNAGVQPEGTVKRYCQKEKKHVLVPRPNCVAAYNQNMGGTDLMDQAVAAYRIGIRGKKWYWPIFTWLIDAALHNAWYICRKNKPISALNFRREIVQIYLTKYKTPAKAAGRISLSRNLIPDIRLDRMDHFVISCNRRRCAGIGCKSFGRTMCQKCDVGLCIKCFAPYHTK